MRLVDKKAAIRHGERRVGSETSRILWRSFGLIFFIAVLVRLGVLFTAFQGHIEWRGEVERIAVTLANENQFANAYTLPTGPTAHNPPGLPFVFSLLFRMFGTGFAGFAAKCGFVIGSYGILFGLMPRIAVAFCLPFEAGFLAGITGALLPVRRTSELYMAWEEPITAMFLAAAAILTFRVLQRRRFGVPAALTYGAIWGVGFHFSPSLAPVWLVFLAIIMIVLQKSKAPVLLPAAVSLLITAAVVMPWTIRNRQKLGSWMFMRSNFGLELRVSHNDLAGPTAADNNEIYGFFHPGFSLDRARELRRMGEAAYHRQMLRDALTWVAAHPARSAWLTIQRVIFFWSGPPRTPATTAIVTVYTAAAFVGLRLLWRQGHVHFGLIVLGIWICFPLVYYLIQANHRYRAPMDWTVLLCAAYAVRHYSRRFARSANMPPNGLPGEV